MKRLLLTLVALLACCLPLAQAGSTLYDGYVYGGCYVYHACDGYFWYNGCAYTRSYCWNPVTYYYSCGCWVAYPRTGYWDYCACPGVCAAAACAPVAAAPVAPAPPAYAPGWKAKMFDYAAARDDAALYQQTVAALGFHGQSLAFQQTVPYCPNPNLGSFGANGTTLYGSFAQTAQQYGATDMNVLYQQAGKLTQGAQSLAGQANTAFSGLVQQAGTNQERVAETLAKGEAAARALAAAAAAPSSTVTTTSTNSRTIREAASVPPGPSAEAPLPDKTRLDEPRRQSDFSGLLRSVVAAKCASCHGDKEPRAGLNLNAWSEFSDEQKERVRDRLLTDDPDKRMPRLVSDEKKPGPALTASERRPFFSN